MIFMPLISMLKNTNDTIVTKMHILATGESLGVLLFIVGLILLFSPTWQISVKLVIFALFFWLSNAITTYNLVKTEYYLMNKQ